MQPQYQDDDFAIRAQSLRKQYGTVQALDDFTLNVTAGSIHGLLGPNGAGKSTAVYVLATLVTADSGTAEVAGIDVAQGVEVRRRIGLIGQDAAVDEILGGRQNLVMFGRLFGLSKHAAMRRADELLEHFDLVKHAHRPVGTYSGGMRRRLDIAAGLILDPQVLFLDEPTTGLDPRGRIDVWQLITEIADRGTTVLLTTQYLEEADQLADRISIMKTGTVIAEGAPAELKTQRGGDRVEMTIGESVTGQQLVQLLATDLGPTPEINHDVRTVTFPAPNGSADLIAAVRRLDAAGIVPDDLTLRRPTLNEVFLALTEQETA